MKTAASLGALVVVTSLLEACGSSSGGGTTGQDAAATSDAAAGQEVAKPADGVTAEALAPIAAAAAFVDQLRQLACANIDRCCGTKAATVKGFVGGGCAAADWDVVRTSLESAVGLGAAWDSAAAAGCIAGLTAELAGPCNGPPLGNRGNTEAIAHIRNSKIASCKTFISAGEKNTGDECGGDFECKAGLQCVYDLIPNVCASLRGAGDNCGDGLLCDFDGLYCDVGSTDACVAVTANGAACTSGRQCADGLCEGSPAVCTAVCR